MAKPYIRSNMNYLAIVIAAIVAWLFGAVYYSTLANYWLAALGTSTTQLMQQMGPRGAYMPYLVSFVAELIMAWCLAGMVGRLGAASVTPRNAVIYALTGWLGFSVATMAVNNAFTARPAMLTLIDSGHWLGVAVIMGLIIGKMGAR